MKTFHLPTVRRLGSRSLRSGFLLGLCCYVMSGASLFSQPLPLSACVVTVLPMGWRPILATVGAILGYFAHCDAAAAAEFTAVSLLSLAAVAVLTFIIIFLVAGLNFKGVTAFGGAMLGVISCAVTGWFFARVFHINGAVMPYSQALLYSGYEMLNLSDIYVGAIFLSSSGAVMDLAMDIASGMDELVLKRQDISHKALFISGIRMGRSVVGTMTTTLLLAYSGGYLTLLMVFAAQGTGFIDILTNPHVASELVKTLVGSFSLVLVAPFTALLGALLLKRPQTAVTPE